MEIIQQPFGRWRDRLMCGTCTNNSTIVFVEDRGIVVEPLCQWPPPFRVRGDPLGISQAFRMLLKTLDAEKLGTDRRLRES